jgi:apolipoprotein N-acyltransferase
MKPLLLALMTGLLFAFSLPPFNQEWLGWFTFVPLLLAAQGRRPLEAIGLGLIAGAAGGFAQAGWHHDTTRLFWAYIPFLWLTFLFGLVALAAARVPATWNPAFRVLFLASVGISGEWLTSFLPLPLNIGLCQYLNLPLLQIASVTGIWGVSFLLWWVNAALVEIVSRKTGPLAPNTGGTGFGKSDSLSGSPIIGGWGESWVPLILGVVMTLMTVGFGVFSLAQTPKNAPTLRVAAIQDLTSEETGDLATVKGEVDRTALTKQAAAQGAKLIVWSEESLGGEFSPDNPKDETRQLARQLKTALVVGYSDDTRPKPFNCAAYIASSGDVLSPAHHKIHLYLSERETNQAGHGATTVVTPQGRIGLEICFDSCYTNTTRQEVQQGAQLIALPNYDPPTPRGVLHRLHGTMLPFRAVENRVPFIRADSNGLSQIVDAEGRIIGQSPLFTPDVLVGSLVLGTGQGTFFTRFGDWLAYGYLLVVLGGVAALRRRPG